MGGVPSCPTAPTPLQRPGASPVRPLPGPAAPVALLRLGLRRAQFGIRPPATAAQEEQGMVWQRLVGTSPSPRAAGHCVLAFCGSGPGLNRHRLSVGVGPATQALPSLVSNSFVAAPKSRVQALRTCRKCGPRGVEEYSSVCARLVGSMLG